MAVKLFVGGLSFSTSSEGLRQAFARFGPVESAAVMTDRETGRSRGFGFVEMATEDEATRAIGALNGSMLDGRMIRVDKATPRGSAPPGGRRPAGPGAGRPSGDRPGGYGGPRPGGFGGGFRPGFGAPPPADTRAGGPSRRDRRAGGRPEGGEQGRARRKGSPRPRPDDRWGGGSGRGRQGSDGDYRWGR